MMGMGKTVASADAFVSQGCSPARSVELNAVGEGSEPDAWIFRQGFAIRIGEMLGFAGNQGHNRSSWMVLFEPANHASPVGVGAGKTHDDHVKGLRTGKGHALIGPQRGDDVIAG